MFFFHSREKKDIPPGSIRWFHHWRFPNGRISISVGKKDKGYWIHFPNIAFFHITTTHCHITAYRENNVPDETIRHLLLDQVIPRLLSHRGDQIIHASCVDVHSRVIAFCGESGWGKSTLAAFFYNSDTTTRLLTDDCLLLQAKNDAIYCRANYPGIRLYRDSLKLFKETPKTIPVTHYGTKERVVMPSQETKHDNQLCALFVLNDPASPQTDENITIRKISGAATAITLLRNSFPLDITDKDAMGSQLLKLAQIGGNKNLPVFSLSFPRNISHLPLVKDATLREISRYTESVT